MLKVRRLYLIPLTFAELLVSHCVCSCRPRVVYSCRPRVVCLFVRVGPGFVRVGPGLFVRVGPGLFVFSCRPRVVCLFV